MTYGVDTNGMDPEVVSVSGMNKETSLLDVEIVNLLPCAGRRSITRGVVAADQSGRSKRRPVQYFGLTRRSSNPYHMGLLLDMLQTVCANKWNYRRFTLRL